MPIAVEYSHDSAQWIPHMMYNRAVSIGKMVASMEWGWGNNTHIFAFERNARLYKLVAGCIVSIRGCFQKQ